MATPHRFVSNLLDGLVSAAEGVGTTVNQGLQSVGGGIQRGLDTPFQAFGGPEQPLRIADRILDGTLGAIDHAANRGGFDSLKMAGEALARGLDHPSEQFGIPPEIGGGGMREFSFRRQFSFKFPQMMKRR